MSIDNKTVVSIIVPVYNQEKYLSKCIESILCQSYQDIQVIIVNDCSTDSSLSIIQKYANKDGRIIIVDKGKNEGLSKARNSGLNYVNGEYLMFFDSDDWVENNMIETMLMAAQRDEADIIICGYRQDRIDENLVTIDFVEVSPSTISDDIFKAIVELDSQKLFSYVWNKLYKFDLIKSSNCVFEDVRLIEDTLFNFEIFKCADKLSVIPMTFYHYVQPPHPTLSRGYIEKEFELLEKRLKREMDIMLYSSTYNNELKSIMSNVYTKSLLAVLINQCNSELTFKNKTMRAGNYLKSDVMRECIQSAKATSIQEVLINSIIKTQSPVILAIGAQIIWTIQKYFPYVFNHLK